MPVRKSPAIPREFTGIEVTQSALTQDALKESEGVVGNAYHELRTGVATAPAVYTDDTGWRIQGQTAHLMTFDTLSPSSATGPRRGSSYSFFFNLSAFCPMKARISSARSRSFQPLFLIERHWKSAEAIDADRALLADLQAEITRLLILLTFKRFQLRFQFFVGRFCHSH